MLFNADSTSTQLYNIKTDPGEKNNLVNKETQKAKMLADKVISEISTYSYNSCFTYCDARFYRRPGHSNAEQVHHDCCQA